MTRTPSDLVPPDLPPSAVEPPTAPGTGGGTVLIIDDEPAIVRVAERMIKLCGFEVLTAEHGEAGVELLRGFRTAHPDGVQAVLLDVTMPGWDCLRTVNALRAIQPGVRIIICSGYGSNHPMPHPPPAGIVAKPYTLTELRRVLETVLRDG